MYEMATQAEMICPQRDSGPLTSGARAGDCRDAPADVTAVPQWFFVTRSSRRLSVAMVTTRALPPSLTPTCTSTRTPTFARIVRRGVTLLELLVVLVILGITAAFVVPPLLSSRPANAAPEQQVETLLSSVRRGAVQRGEPVRLRLEDDGAWAVVGQRSGSTVDTGRLAAGVRRLDVTVDPRGTCTPVQAGRTANGTSVRDSAAGALNGLSFDPLACRTVADTVR